MVRDSTPPHSRANRFFPFAEIFVPAATAPSTRMSRELKRKGFTFVGPTICYAFMQAVGMVNDHVIDCFRYDQVKNMSLQA